MKRFTTILLSGLISGIVLSSTAFAGIDYNKNHEDFMSQKNLQKSSSTEKHLGHTNKYERQEPMGTAVPSKDSGQDRPAGKYDRPSWAPGK